MMMTETMEYLVAVQSWVCRRRCRLLYGKQYSGLSRKIA